MEQTNNLKAKIAELRQRYARLAAICGPMNISRQTIEAYKKEIAALEAQLN